MHITKIFGDVLQKQDLCAACFDVVGSSEVEFPRREDDDLCYFCGGKSDIVFTDPLAIGFNLPRETKMCPECFQEYGHYVGAGIESVPRECSEAEQLQAFWQLYHDVQAHMKEWLSQGRR